MREKCQEGDVVSADEAGTTEEAFVVQEGNFSFHFVDSVCNGHNNCF